ncbi:MAG: cob(I)yrinic acid a,c-diamide adenosyltransferase [Deltaproteobacteria bacterium]|nr:cob(I)yrinic acid a,c-diamide adenosyltransferase [Deltaproteobacteria bacterium]
MKAYNQGYVQVYTGDGKGKTTAAIGLAVRAAGAELKVFIAQFLKMGDYSEIKSLKKFSENITVEQFGRGRFRQGKPLPEDVESAKRGLEKVTSVMNSGEYDVVILEEANIAVWKGLFPEQDLLDIIDAKPMDVELVLTGRGATSKVIERADLVTEMKRIKHYYYKGVRGRVGIEK